MRKRRPIAGAGRTAAWERSRDELTPGEIEELREPNRQTPPPPILPAAVPEPRPPQPIPTCGDPDCSVCRGYRSRRYW